MAVFLSYSRRDQTTVKTLARGLEAARLPVWLDSELSGGDAWWDKILGEIRDCSVFVFALSDASLSSKPCLTELEYAGALGREIVPVQVGPVASFHSSPLSAVHIVGYRPDEASSGFEVLAAVNAAAKRQAPLPDQLPPEPPIPFAYLQALGRQIDNEVLNPPDQTAVVEQLRKGLREESEDSVRAEILGMLDRLLTKQWVTIGAQKEIRAVLYAYRSNGTETTTPAPPGATPDPPPEQTDPPAAAGNGTGTGSGSGAAAPQPSGQEIFEKKMAEMAERRRREEREQRERAGPGVPNHEWKPSTGPSVPWSPGHGNGSGAGSGAGSAAPVWRGVSGPATATPPATSPPVSPPAAHAGAQPVPEPRTEAFPSRTFTGPPQQPPHTRPSPPNYWALSIIAAVVTVLVPGGVAMYYSYQVGQLYQARDYDGAERASKLAKGWGVGCLIFFAVVLVLSPYMAG